MFWISFQDLLKYFYDITVCKVRSDWLESRQSSYFFDFSTSAQVHLLTVTQSGLHHFEIELFSTGTKYKMYDRNDDPDIDLCLVLCSVDDPENGNGLRCIAFEHNVEYFITISASLTPGNYLIFATSFKAIRNVSLTTYTDSQINDPDYYTYNLVLHGQGHFLINNKTYPAEIVSDIFYSVALYKNKIKHDLNNSVRSLIIQGYYLFYLII
jgi:hypothetical protein